MTFKDYFKLLRKRKDLMGIAAAGLGAGILLAAIMPYLGWILFSAFGLVALGVLLIKQ